MDLKKAFPLCDVQVFAADDRCTSDTYHVARVWERGMKLVAFRHQVTGRIPAVEDRLFVQSALPDAAYGIVGRVTDVSVGEYVVVGVEQETEVARIQRRRNFRVVARLSVQVEEMDEDDNVKDVVDLVTEDASAGGIRVLRSQEMTPEERVRLKLDLGDGDSPVECNAKVVRCNPSDQGNFEIGMTFDEVEEKDKDRIIRTLMQMMREMVRSQRRLNLKEEVNPSP